MDIRIILLLPIMIFMHIVDDFYLQGKLAQMKQRSWWVDQVTKMCKERNLDALEMASKYKFDYIVCVFAHAFSWSFMITLPLLIFHWNEMNVYHTILYIIYLIGNMVIHAGVDHMKANQLLINLVTDQACHILQIVVTWFMWHILF